MKKVLVLAAVLHYFKSYETSKECFVTNDGMIFHVEENAIAHDNSTVKNGNIAHFERDAIADIEKEYAKALAEEGLKPKKAEKVPAATTGNDTETEEESEEEESEAADTANAAPAETAKAAAAKKAAAPKKKPAAKKPAEKK